MIPDALQIRHHLQSGGYLAQIPRYWLLAQNQRKAAGFNGPLHIIDRPVPLNDLLCQSEILILKGNEGLFNGRNYHVSHLF